LLPGPVTILSATSFWTITVMDSVGAPLSKRAIRIGVVI
jgi:hypothetical protein